MCVFMCVSVRGELECVCVWQGNVCVECVCMHVCMAGKCMCGVCVCVCVCVRQGNVCVCTKRVHVHGGETERGSAQNSTTNDPILRCIID